MASLMETLGIDKLSADERLQLLDELWESLSVSADQPPLTEEQKQEIDRRLEAYKTNPNDVVRWEDLAAQIEEKLRR